MAMSKKMRALAAAKLRKGKGKDKKDKKEDDDEEEDDFIIGDGKKFIPAWLKNKKK